MRITAITQQKRDPSRYNIFIDGEYAFALPMQDILYFKLKEGQEAAEETIAFIRKNLIYIKAQDTALRFLGYKMRTVQESQIYRRKAAAQAEKRLCARTGAAAEGRFLPYHRGSACGNGD